MSCRASGRKSLVEFAINIQSATSRKTELTMEPSGASMCSPKEKMASRFVSTPAKDTWRRVPTMNLNPRGNHGLL